MKVLVDCVTALWVIACLSSLVIVIAQERPVLPWLLATLATGPVAVFLLLTRRPSHGARLDGELCGKCFSRLKNDDPCCPRCHDQRTPSSVRPGS